MAVSINTIGTGDIKCMTKKKTVQEFITDAIAVHGDRYIYTNVEYTNTNTPVSIVCREHGPFMQRPNRHVSGGDGCPTCGDLRTKAAITRSASDIIVIAGKVHNNKYQYGALMTTGYNGNGIIPVECPEHGPFTQRLADHIHKGAGCPQCANNARNTDRKLTLSAMIDRANLVHGNRYDYSGAKYKSSTTKIEVGCPLHGKFLVTPDNHVNNSSGCPRCYESKGERMVTKVLTQLSLSYVPQYTYADCVNPITVAQHKNRSLLRYDFYVPAKNVLIEYDGFFHYNHLPAAMCADREKADRLFKQTIQNDAIKTLYALHNNTSLIRVPYFCKLPAQKLTQCLALMSITKPCIITLV